MKKGKYYSAVTSKISSYSAGVIIALYIFFSLLACTESREGKGTLLPATTPQAARTLSGWEAEWQSTLEKARKEGIVTVTSGMGPQVSKPLVEAFKNRFGIPVEWITGRAVELSERVLRERRAGIYSYDLYSAGHPIALTSLKPAGAFSPMEPLFLLPDVKDPKNWFQNRLPWADRDKTVFSFWLDANPNITINTNLVKKDEIKSYFDLLDPKWKGKIIMDDPTVSGSANTWALTIGNFFPSMGWDFQRSLARQEPLLSRDRRLQFVWLVQGKYLVTLPNISVGQDMKKDGAPLDFLITKEGLYASSSNANLAYYSNAPHPNAARVFMNWLLTKEAQEIAAIANGSESTRLDVSTSHLPQGWSREEIIKSTGSLVYVDPETTARSMTESTPTILEIWRPLLK